MNLIGQQSQSQFQHPGAPPSAPLPTHQSVYHGIIGQPVGSSSTSSASSSISCTSSTNTDIKNDLIDSQFDALKSTQSTSIFDTISHIWSSSFSDSEQLLPTDKLNPFLSTTNTDLKQIKVEASQSSLMSSVNNKPIGYERHGKQSATVNSNLKPSISNSNLSGQLLNLNLNEGSSFTSNLGFYNQTIQQQQSVQQKQYALINPISQPNQLVKKQSIGSHLSDLTYLANQQSQNLNLKQVLNSNPNLASLFPPNGQSCSLPANQWLSLNQQQQQYNHHQQHQHQAQFDLLNGFLPPAQSQYSMNHHQTNNFVNYNQGMMQQGVNQFNSSGFNQFQNEFGLDGFKNVGFF